MYEKMSDFSNADKWIPNISINAFAQVFNLNFKYIFVIN